MSAVVGAGARVLRAEGRLPEHHAAELGGVLVLVEGEELVGFVGREVRVFV